jgi:hypothetical protein
MSEQTEYIDGSALSEVTSMKSLKKALFSDTLI